LKYQPCHYSWCALIVQRLDSVATRRQTGEENAVAEGGHTLLGVAALLAAQDLEKSAVKEKLEKGKNKKRK
jgi:hypothetical protein